ncbi:MAG: hypothetical protein ABEK16_00435 [Candidatus Nanohalobium sp.]
MEEDTLKEVIDLFNKDFPAFIMWISGIESEIGVPKIKKEWEIGDTNVFSQPVFRYDDSKPDKLYREYLSDLGIIETSRGTKNRTIVRSNTKWLADLVELSRKEDKAVKEGDKELDNFDINWHLFLKTNEEGLREFFDSGLFREKLMSRELILDEIREARESQDKRDKKLWKTEINWQLLMNQHIKSISILKGVQEEGQKAWELFPENPDFFGTQIPHIQTGELDIEELHKVVEHGEIPDIVKKGFTTEEKASEYAEELNGIKEKWPELYKKIKSKIE